MLPQDPDRRQTINTTSASHEWYAVVMVAGGTPRGPLIREVDALGGLTGRVASASLLYIRICGAMEGVWNHRAISRVLQATPDLML